MIVIRRKNNICLCMNKMCVKIKCIVIYNDMDCVWLIVICKMEIINVNDDDCFIYFIDKLIGKMIL